MPMKTSGTHLIHSAERQNIVLIADARRSRDEIADAKFARFIAARDKCWQPGATLEDGIAAGKAYAAFLDAYVGRRA